MQKLNSIWTIIFFFILECLDNIHSSAWFVLLVNQYLEEWREIDRNLGNRAGYEELRDMG